MGELVSAASRMRPERRERGARVRFGSARALAVALAAVVLFWWAATGITIAMQRDTVTRGVGLGAATALAGLALWLVRAARHEATPAGALRSFAGGALLWAWLSTLFYGAWVTGTRPDAVAGGGPSLALAAQAIAATLHADLLGVAVLLVVAGLTRRAPNRVGLWTLLLFWGAHQTAKLNVFFGVRHAGAEFLPGSLAHLEQFFGPARNSALLAPTLALLAGVTAALVAGALRARTPFARTASALLAALAALALLEHAFLGLETTLPLWDGFLRARGG